MPPCDDPPLHEQWVHRVAVPLSAGDRRAILALLEPAQLVYGLTLLPKKSVLDDPHDVELLRQRLQAMRTAADGISKGVRESTKVPWLLLLDERDSPNELWATAKKVTPKILSELSPLVRDAPEAAFFSVPPEKDRPSRTKGALSKARPAGAPRRPKR
jgi:hypothetical protein